MSHVSLIRPFRTLPALALAVVALAMTGSPAAASDQAGVQARTSGKATLTLGTGKAGKALTRQGVKITGISPARVKRLSGKRFRVTLKAAGVSSNPARVRLKGGIRLSHNGRGRPGQRLPIPVRTVTVQGNHGQVTVTGKVAGKKLRIFTGRGRVSTVRGDVVRVKIRNARLRLTARAARLIRKKLKLRRRVPAGPVGTASVNARKRNTPVVTEPDPYFAQCGISAETESPGSLPAPAPLPDMTGATALAASTPDIAWGFKASFRGYIGGTGSLHAVNGAGRDGAGPIAGFTFPVKNGSYRANDPVDTSDDQAVINGRGAAVFCSSHGFRVAISKPAIVIDGTNARIVADIDTNYFGIWTPAQRIDLAELDLDGITPFYNRSGSEVTWQDIPATLTAGGAEAFCEPPSDDRPGQCLYHEGDALDPVTATVRTAPAGVEPFPLTAYCDWTTSTNTRRIDPDWPGVALPPLDSSGITGVATTSASLDWGVKKGLRGTPPYNVITPTVGDGATMSNPGDMTGDGKYFTWPGTAGTLDATGDRLVQSFQGKVGLCQKVHGFGTVITDPTVVIDGDNSRLSADVATRVGDDGDWIRGRTDIVTFKASEALLESSTGPGVTNYSWTLPDEDETGKEGVVVGEQGARLLESLGYAAGTRFQGMTINVTVPS